jgi:hypothetical protein
MCIEWGSRITALDQSWKRSAKVQGTDVGVGRPRSHAVCRKMWLRNRINEGQAPHRALAPLMICDGVEYKLTQNTSIPSDNAWWIRYLNITIVISKCEEPTSVSQCCADGKPNILLHLIYDKCVRYDNTINVLTFLWPCSFLMRQSCKLRNQHPELLEMHRTCQLSRISWHSRLFSCNLALDALRNKYFNIYVTKSLGPCYLISRDVIC